MHMACKLFSSTLKWEHFQWPHEPCSLFSPHLLCFTTHHYTLIASICTCGYICACVPRECVLLPCVLCKCGWHLHLSGWHLCEHLCHCHYYFDTPHCCKCQLSQYCSLSLCLFSAFQGHCLRLLRVLDIDWNSASCCLFNQYADISLWNYFRKWKREMPPIPGFQEKISAFLLWFSYGCLTAKLLSQSADSLLCLFRHEIITCYI